MNKFTKGLNASIERLGFQTSKDLQADSSQFAIKFNNASKELERIKSDTSRTRSERASLIDKAKSKRVKEIQTSLDLMVSNHVVRAEKLLAEKESALTFRSSEATMFLLAQELKSNQTDISKLSKVDARYMQALNHLPASYFGLEQASHDSIINASLKVHNPDLTQRIEQSQLDYDHVMKSQVWFKDVSKTYDNEISKEALSSRFDEKELI